MKKIITLATLTILISACTAKPTDPNWRPDMTTANFGKYPTTYYELIQKWGIKNFDKPEKISYVTISLPRQEYIVNDSEKQQATFGFSVCADISGVKTTNYYKPISKHWYFIRDNKVIEHRVVDNGYNRVIYRDHKINCDDGE